MIGVYCVIATIQEIKVQKKQYNQLQIQWMFLECCLQLETLTFAKECFPPFYSQLLITNTTSLINQYHFYQKFFFIADFLRKRAPWQLYALNFYLGQYVSTSILYCDFVGQIGCYTVLLLYFVIYRFQTYCSTHL